MKGSPNRMASRFAEKGFGNDSKAIKDLLARFRGVHLVEDVVDHPAKRSRKAPGRTNSRVGATFFGYDHFQPNLTIIEVHCDEGPQFSSFANHC